MTDEELQQFATLAKKYEREKDKDKVLLIVKDDLHEVFQEINDGGRSAANTANQVKLEQQKTEYTTQLNQLKLQKDDLDRQVEELQSKTPDIVKLRQGYEKQAKELEDKVKEVQGQLTTTQQALTTELQNERQNRDLADFERFLVNECNVDADYAHEVLAKRDDVKDRIVRDDKNKVQVRKKGQTDIFLQPTDTKTALQLLAEELTTGIADKWKVSKVRRGSGTKAGDVDSGGGGASSGDRTRLATIRDEEKSRGKTDEGKKRPSGFSRLTGGA